MDRRRLIVGAGALAATALLPGNANAFLRGGAVDLTIRRQQYVNMGFGMFFHFGMNTFTDREVELGTEAANTFNPSALDLDQWIATAVAAKAKYVVWIAKHHGGFCMFPTASFGDVTRPARSLTQSAWYSANGNYNITQQFVLKARAAGLQVGLYFSIRDASSCLQFATDAEWLAYTQTQLTEISAYKPDFFWLDGAEWWFNAKPEKAYPWPTQAARRAFFDSLRTPPYLVVNNSKQVGFLTSDILENEYSSPPTGNIDPSETCDTIRSDGKWFWGTAADTPRTASYILGRIADLKSKNGTYLLNVNPDTTGQVPSNLVSICTTVGASLP